MDDEPRDGRNQPPQERRSGQVRIIGAEPAANRAAGGAEEPVSGRHVAPERADEVPGPAGGEEVDEEMPWPRAEDPWSSNPDLLHWTDAPTGEIPAVLAREEEGPQAPSDDPWSSLPPPTWREEQVDWEAHEGFSSVSPGDQERLGVLDDSAASEQPWRFELPETLPAPAAGQTFIPSGGDTAAHSEQAHSFDPGVSPGPVGEPELRPGRHDLGASPGALDEPTGMLPAVGRHDDEDAAGFDRPLAGAPETGALGGRGDPYATSAPATERSQWFEEELAPPVASAPDPAAQGVEDAGWAGGHEPAGIYDGENEAGGGPGAPVASEVLAPSPGGPAVTGPDPGELDLSGRDLVAEEELWASETGGGQDLIDADDLLGPTTPRRGSRAERRRHSGRGAPSAPQDAEAATEVRQGERARGRHPGARRRPEQAAAARTEHRHRPPPERQLPERQSRSGRNVPLAIASGVIIGLATLIVFALGNVASLIWVTILLAVAAAEGFAAFRRAGYRPATLLGLVAVVALMVATYNKGAQAVPLVLVLLLAFSLLWYMAGVERAEPVRNSAVTLLVFIWVGVFGSYAALLLNPSLFPDRHGIAFLVGAIITSVAYDVGALAVGAWIGRRPLAPGVSPHKTWEGLIGGSVAAIVVAVVVVHAISPWTVGKALALGVVVAVVAPLGDLCESLIKRGLGLKDMGRALPGHGGLLDRFDGLLFVLPATYYLVKAVHLG